MSISHSFSVKIAKQLKSVNEALILQHLYFWITKNKSDGVNFQNNTYWTYSPIRAFEEIFDYLTTHEIRGAIAKLEEKGYIIKDHFPTPNKKTTLWYAITDMGFELLEVKWDLSSVKNKDDSLRKPQIPFAETANTLCGNRKPNNKEDSNIKDTNIEDIKKINKKSPLADKEFLDTFYFYKMQIGALKQFPTEHKETQEMTKAYQSWNKVLKDYDAEQIQQSCKVYFEYIEITKLTWDGGGRPVRGDFTTWLNNFHSFDSWNGLKTQEMQKPKYKAMEDKRQDALREKKRQEDRQKISDEDRIKAWLNR